jgi:LSD1 subclass zinc finger protein
VTESAIACPQCATRLHLPPGNTATRFRCTQCNTVFDTGAPAPPTPPAPLPVPVPVPLPVPVPVPDFTAPTDDEDDDRPRRRRRRRDEDDADDEPRRKPARRAATGGAAAGGVSFALVAVVGSVVLVAAAIGAYFAFRPAPKEKDSAKADPGKDAPKPGPKNAPALTQEQVVRKVKASTVYVRTFFARDKGATGSGFFAGKPGYVVTNAHVIGYGPDKIMVPEQVEVVIDSGETNERTFVTKVIAVDVPADLALLKVEGPNLPPVLAFGRAEGLLETQEVAAYGYPFGENLGKNVSINRTTVSSLRKVNGSIERVQLAGGINPGNSGGPVVNAKGEVVGVSVAKLRVTDSVAFAIPAEIAQQFADEQIRTGGEFRLGELTPP